MMRFKSAVSQLHLDSTSDIYHQYRSLYFLLLLFLPLRFHRTLCLMELESSATQQVYTFAHRLTFIMARHQLSHDQLLVVRLPVPRRIQVRERVWDEGLEWKKLRKDAIDVISDLK